MIENDGNNEVGMEMELEINGKKREIVKSYKNKNYEMKMM